LISAQIKLSIEKSIRDWVNLRLLNLLSQRDMEDARILSSDQSFYLKHFGLKFLLFALENDLIVKLPVDFDSDLIPRREMKKI